MSYATPLTTTPQLDVGRLFVTCLAAGAAAIGLAQLMGSTLLSVLLPLGIMLAYVRLARRSGAVGQMMEQFADSIYYMGFLFTLGALVASLLTLETSAVDMGLLVNNFAMALVTTILGLSLRIYFNHFRREARTEREALDQELILATRNLVTHVREVGRHMEANNEEMMGALKGALAQVEEGMARAGESLEHTSQEAGRGVVRAAQKLKRELEGVSIPDSLLTDRLEPPLSRLAERLEETEVTVAQVNEREAAIAASLSAVHQRLENLTEQFDDFSRGLHGLQRNWAEEDTQRRALAELTAQLARLLKEADSVQARLAAQAGHMEAVGTRGAEFAASLEEVKESLADSATGIRDNALALREARRSLRALESGDNSLPGNLIALNDALGQSRESLAALARTRPELEAVVRELAEVRGGIGKLTQALSASAAVAARHAEDSRAHQEALASLTAESRGAVSQVTRDLTSAARYVVDRLGTE